MPRPPTDKTTINIRLPKDLLEKLNEYATLENGYPDRSSAISDAIEFLINAKECIHCGTLNAEKGIHCSACNDRLYSDDELKTLMKCARKYGLIVSSADNYENHIEPIPNNPFYHKIEKSIKEYTKQGLLEEVTPKIDKSYPYDDLRRYKFEVSFKFRDTGVEVLPKQKIEFYIPPNTFRLIMMDQFKKPVDIMFPLGMRHYEPSVPSDENLEIYTDFNKIQAKSSDEAFDKFRCAVFERYNALSMEQEKKFQEMLYHRKSFDEIEEYFKGLGENNPLD